MQTIRLGQTNITVSKNGFGALPIQRVSSEDAVRILRKAYEGGINYFDTARFYTDSEEKLGLTLSDVRENIIISTKTMCNTTEDFWRDLGESLELLKTDYIDIYQFHNPSFCPKPGDGTGLYEAMLEAKAQGKIRHIGITNHRLAVAEEAVLSGLYETLQFPFSYLASEKEEALVKLCEERDVGFICMKALAGGARFGASNQLAANEEQRCISLISRRFYECWTDFNWSENLRPVHLLVKFGAGGRIAGYRIVQSSGDTKVDQSVLAAAKRAGYVAGLSADFLKKYPEITIEMKPKRQ